MKEEKIAKEPLINRTYQHYKGGRFKVIACARNEANDQIVVVYQSIPFGTIWFRPLSEWNEEVNVKSFQLTDMDGNGIVEPTRVGGEERFRLIS